MSRPSSKKTLVAPEPSAEELANSAWLAVMSKVSTPPVIPPEFRSKKQLMALWGIGKTATSNRLTKLKALGFVEEKSFPAADVNGRYLPTPHYRLK